MAKPIKAPPTLRGEAAEKLIRHLEQGKPSPEKAERIRKAQAAHAQIPRRD